LVTIDLATNTSPDERFTLDWNGFLSEGEYLEVRARKKGAVGNSAVWELEIQGSKRMLD
jgi:hypothetical protein